MGKTGTSVCESVAVDFVLVDTCTLYSNLVDKLATSSETANLSCSPYQPQGQAK